MADNAGRAAEHAERMEPYLAEAIAAARATQAPEADHCADCGEELLAHRREFGRCVDCQREREAVQRMRAVGV